MRPDRLRDGVALLLSGLRRDPWCRICCFRIRPGWAGWVRRVPGWAFCVPVVGPMVMLDAGLRGDRPGRCVRVGRVTGGDNGILGAVGMVSGKRFVMNGVRSVHGGGARAARDHLCAVRLCSARGCDSLVRAEAIGLNVNCITGWPL